jgi:hypothetical protein
MRTRNGPLLRPGQAPILFGAARLLSINPFLGEQVEVERLILRDDFVGDDRFIIAGDVPDAPLENTRRIGELLRPVVDDVCAALAAGTPATDEERRAYRGAALYDLYIRFDLELQHVADTGKLRDGVWERFVAEHRRLFLFSGSGLDVPGVVHLFGVFYQVRRAFHAIHTGLRGRSRPAALLRGTVWEEIFAGDLERYVTWSYSRMDTVSTLILGDTGTGKELVARAIGLSRYLAFDPETRTFAGRPDADFFKLNISALPASLIDSLLFGYKQGAFTGAIKDTPGSLSLGAAGALFFLDEIGDLDPLIQVKLLRVIQERRYLAVGDTRETAFLGRMISATQPGMIRDRRLRDDFYYRICANMIELPTLRARLDDDPGELRHLVRSFAAVRGGPVYGARLEEEVLAFIDAKLRHHDWPGNVRELLACVGSVHAHHRYTPRAGVPGGALPAAVTQGSPSLEEVQRRYAQTTHEKTGGNFKETGRLLGIDYRTLRRLLDPPGTPPRARRNAH